MILKRELKDKTYTADCGKFVVYDVSRKEKGALFESRDGGVWSMEVESVSGCSSS
jgi:hypothetical protein